MTTIDRLGNAHTPAGTPGAGEFTTKRNTPPPTSLQPEVAPAVSGSVRLQRWTGHRQDRLTEVGEVSLDMTGALDTLPLDTVRTFGEAGDNDNLFEVLREHGLVDHDGPFDVDLDTDELASYIQAREMAGAETPKRAIIAWDRAAIIADLSAVAAEERSLQDRKRTLTAQYVASAVAAEVPEARHVIANPQSYPYLFDGERKRIMIDEETAERLRVTLDDQRIVGSFEL